MQVASLVLGILAAVGMFIALFPCLGALNWLNVPFSLIGLVISAVALGTSNKGNKGGSIAGVILCSVAMVFGLIRLVLGGGII